MFVMPPVVCPSCSFSNPMAMTTSYMPEATRLSAAQKTVAPVVPPVVRRNELLPGAPVPSECHRSGWCTISKSSMLPCTMQSTSSMVRPASSRASRTASCTISGWFTSSRWLECFVCPIPITPTFRFFFLCPMITTLFVYFSRITTV